MNCETCGDHYDPASDNHCPVCHQDDVRNPSTVTTPYRGCTDEQRAEWNALMDEVRKLTEESRDMEREAGATLAWSLRHPRHEDFAMKKALEEAQRAVDLWARRVELRAQADANPYSAVVRARGEAS